MIVASWFLRYKKKKKIRGQTYQKNDKERKKVSRKGKMEAFNKMICRECQAYLIIGHKRSSW